MDLLPDELWLRIVHLGIEDGSLRHQEICRLAALCSRLHGLCSLDSVWKLLCEVQARNDSGDDASKSGTMSRAKRGEVDWKTAYRMRYDSLKARRKSHARLAWAELAGFHNDCQRVRGLIDSERKKLSRLFEDVANLKRARQAGVALQRWQPRVVRAMHEALVEQQPLNSDSQLHLLEMGIRVCKNLILTYEQSLVHKGQLIEERRLRLESVFSEHRPNGAKHVCR